MCDRFLVVPGNVAKLHRLCVFKDNALSIFFGYIFFIFVSTFLSFFLFKVHLTVFAFATFELG